MESQYIAQPTHSATSGDGQGKRKGSNRKFRKRLMMMTGKMFWWLRKRYVPMPVMKKRVSNTNKKSWRTQGIDVGWDIVSQQCRGRRRPAKREEETGGESKDDGFIPVRLRRNNMAGEISKRERRKENIREKREEVHPDYASISTMIGECSETIIEKLSKFKDVMAVIISRVETLEKDVKFLKKPRRHEDATPHSNLNRPVKKDDGIEETKVVEIPFLKLWEEGERQEGEEERDEEGEGGEEGEGEVEGEKEGDAEGELDGWADF